MDKGPTGGATVKGLQVESHHLSVGAGDAAIHLLTCDPLPGYDKNKRRVILQAYLVDGGQQSHSAQIQEAIQDIEAYYKSPWQDPSSASNKNYLKFDGFIITHWHEDHYGGLEDWITSNVIKGKNGSYFIPRAHYDGENPSSIIYSPCKWPPESSFTVSENLMSLGDKKNLLRVRQTYDVLIGKNIFLQYSKKGNVKGTIKDLNTLLYTKNPVEVPYIWPDLELTVNTSTTAIPAMYCVAADSKIANGNTVALDSDKNKTSLAFLIVWKHPGSKYQDGKHHISHYFAGDAPSNLEEALAKWIDGSYDPKKQVSSKYGITSMKLSHHGADTSNPRASYRQFQPENIIVSAGSAYGHPNWKIVLEVFFWFHAKQQESTDGTKSYKPFDPCQWPHWLIQGHNLSFGLETIKEEAMKKEMEDLYGDGGLNPGKTLLGAAEEFFDELNRARGDHDSMVLRNPFPSCWPNGTLKTESLLKVFQAIMDKISRVDPPVNGDFVKVGFRKPDVKYDRFLGYCAVCAADEEDGEVYTIGWERSTQTDSSNSNGPAMVQDFPKGCSAALFAARRMKGTDKQCHDLNTVATGAVDMFPYKGIDEPRIIDITKGLPQWNVVVKSWPQMSPMPTESKESDLPELLDGDWDNLDDFKSVVSFGSHQVCCSTRASRDESDSDPSATRDGEPAQTWLPRISFQEVPAEVRAMVAPVYITCQDEKNPKSTPKAPEGSKAYALPPGNPLCGFLNTLHLQGVGLSQVPDAKNTTPIDVNDEVFQWLARYSSSDPENSPIPSGFALGMRKVPEWPIPNLEQAKLHFEMTIPYLTEAHLRFSTDEGAKLTFSRVDETDNENSQKAVTEDALEHLLKYRRSLVFGLEDLTTPLRTNLADFAKYMRVNVLSNPLLKYFANDLSLILCTKKDFHNAIWFRPSMDYETVMRLQFHVDTSKFNSWLHDLSPSLNVDTLRVIGRKKASWIWSSPNDKMAFTSSMIFLCRMSISQELKLDGVFALAKDSVSLTLTLNRATIERSSLSIEAMTGSTGILEDVMKWLADNFQVADKKGLDEVLDKAKDSKSGVISDDTILPRRIAVQLSLDNNGKISGVRRVAIDIEACVTIGRPAAVIVAETPTVFLFTIGWSEGRGFHLRGKLWSVIPDTPFTPYDRALPDFEEYEYLQPMTPVKPENQLRTIDIARLLSDKDSEVKNLPTGIPNEIYLCEISLSQTNVAFTGSLRCSKPLAADPSTGGTSPSPPIPPTISLEKVELAASYTWGTKSPNEDGFQMKLSISLDLYLGGELTGEKRLQEQYDSAARLSGEVTYDRGNWAIGAAASNLNVLHLLPFWDVQDRGPISDFLGKVKIDFIKLKYEFNNGKTKTGAFIDDGKDVRSPSQLAIDGQFTFSNVASLKFEYANTGGDGWSLKAFLGPSEVAKDNATIGGLLAGFLDTVVVNSLPSGIRDATIQGANGDEALKMLISKRQGVSVFVLMVQVGKVSVWFIQLRHGPKGAVKRILKAAISKISVDVSALQTTINSPWEELFFMWVQDQTVPKEGVDALKGITQKEYEAMSEMMKDKLNVTDEQLLLFKPTAKKDTSLDGELQGPAKASPSGGDQKEGAKVVMAAGYHLVIVAKKDGKPGVILDYLFGAKKKPASSKMYGAPDSKGKGPDASSSEKGVKAPYKVKLGPLSVGNVGLWFKDGMIGVTLDANLIMGPIGLSLLGFTIGVPFSRDYSLAKPPPPSAIEWGLQGLILAMDKPPLTIAGGFMRDTSDPKVKVMYTGGLIVGFKPWSFEAMGAYATVYKTQTQSGEWITTIDTKPMSQLSLLSTDDGRSTHDNEVAKLEEDTRQTFTFSFIYVKMNGPLFSVGFADVAGLVGGFGINSDITLPTVDQVIQFPFVAERDSKEESSPVERMQGLMKGTWFRPAEGLYWAAAGARVTAFQMFAANIVLVLQFGNGNLLFGIFGVATCDVPALDAPVKFAHVELGIVCTFDATSGIFKFEAQLSPRSFVLAPQCHLTGGMALFSWTKSDIRDPDERNRISAGDWVLTIGGYHRAFIPPKQYPNPPRLGISWSLSSCLSVKGEAYFAITPKICMGGGKIRAALSVGPLYAWFDAFMDFLMNFEPFYFQMTARVSVGVRFTLDLWLVTIRISVEISAGLDLMGPPFGGIVHVDFWVFGFDIKFGSSPPAPDAIGLERFFKIATKTNSSTASSRGLLEGGQPQDKPMADTAAILLTCETGLLPPLKEAKKKSGTPTPPGRGEPNGDRWYVKGGNFTLNASFQIPVTSARLTERRSQTSTTGESQEETRSADCTIDGKYKQVFAKPMQLRDPLSSAVAISVKSPEPRMEEKQDFHILADWKDQKWKLTAQVKPVQSSIWGLYNKNEDPSQVKGNIQGLLSGKDATMQLVTGISIAPPDPAIAGDKVNKFNVTKDHMASVFNPEGQKWPLFIGASEKQEAAWEPKERGKSWDDVKDAWSGVGDATTSKVVDLWAKRMSYDEDSVNGNRTDGEQSGKFEPLRGSAPKKLLNGFKQLVPALPLVAVGY
ncbi:hypothetical protein FPCIR_3318 [Fusarium pseudocircinatum]|uniref:DUF6603 domain-containing protein n=1 Tax=Fusarium pseudocircinatum TaxID=56676 RepID=A0A8H5PJE6_9HYPO|nr:hypothetical protein FPCIR_3318 [Fusarium pseudocircinatum]